ncbi:hypothetical protein AAKU58_004129 [Oxalobacteraceae bacterium GrIS 1.18]
MKRRQWILGVALVGAACIAFFGDGAPDVDTDLATNHAQAASSNTDRTSQVTANPDPRAKSSSAPAPLIALISRDILMKTRSTNERANLFAAYTSHPVVATSVAQNGPTIPALSFKYLGRRTKGDGWEVFLEKNDIITIATTSEMVDDYYRIISISASAITFEYVPTHDQTILTIE